MLKKEHGVESQRNPKEEILKVCPITRAFLKKETLESELDQEQMEKFAS